MAGRDDFDIVTVLVDVVAPAVASVFRAGEVESVSLAWEESVTLPDGAISEPTELNVHLVCKGEWHTSNLWQVGNQVSDRAELVAHLTDEFADFVAESQYGWGQQR